MSGRSAALAVAGFALFAVLLLGLVSMRPPDTQTLAPTPSATPTSALAATATASSPPTATAAAATQTARLPRPCEGISYQTGEEPIVPPRLAGRHMQVALDYVRPGRDGNNRWGVRFFVPEAAPAPAVIPLSASVTGPSGHLAIGRYEAGPPNAGSVEVTGPVTLQPCSMTAPPGSTGTVLITVESAPVQSGTYTLTWRDIRLPEGGTRTETWTVTLTCTLARSAPAAPPATECK